MSAISAVSSVMTQALTMKPPVGSLPSTPSPYVAAAPNKDGDTDAAMSPLSALSSGKLLNISA
jgi:hypothetical protein